MNLRVYQRSGVDAIGKCLQAPPLRAGYAPSTLLVLATGLGKTVTFSHAIKEHTGPKRAMVIAHRDELIQQNARTINAVLGAQTCDIEQGDSHADLMGLHAKAKVIVASKDSLHAKRLARFDPAEFGMLVTDEAHHGVADSYRRIYEYFRDVPHLGVTATPHRTDARAMGQVFDSVAMSYGIAEGITDGWLVNVIARTVEVRDLRLDTVATVAGDFNQGQLAEQLERDKPMHEIAASVTKECGDRRGLIFTVSVRQAQMLADILNDYRPHSAACVHGETDPDTRRRLIKQHKEGELQHLCNVGLFTEGYDDPGVSVIVMARPTKSIALFTQIIGRGTRPLPKLVDDLEDTEARLAAIAASDKPDCMVLDFTGNCGKHKLVTTADALAGNRSSAAVKAAAERQQGETVDVMKAIAEAEKEIEERGTAEDRKNLMQSRTRILALAQYFLTEQNLFDGGMFKLRREKEWVEGKAPTAQQLACLEGAGFKREDLARLSRNECARLQGEMMARRFKKLCSFKQARLLGNMGMSPEQIKRTTSDEAQARISGLYASRGR